MACGPTGCRLAAASAAAELQKSTDLAREAVGYSGVLGHHLSDCLGLRLIRFHHVTDRTLLRRTTCCHATPAKIVGIIRLIGTKQGHPPSTSKMPSVLNQRSVSRANRYSAACNVLS